MYVSATCTRCGREFSTSTGATLCGKCASRRANGKRLAAENRENRAYEREENARLARQQYADIFDIPLSDVPAYVGDPKRDPLFGQV